MSDIKPMGGAADLRGQSLDQPLAARNGSPAFAPDLGLEFFPWMDDAACTGADVNLFFPEPSDLAAAKIAKAICGGCPVKADCLQFALDRHEFRDGIFGGLSPRERQKLRKGAAA